MVSGAPSSWWLFTSGVLLGSELNSPLSHLWAPHTAPYSAMKIPSGIHVLAPRGERSLQFTAASQESWCLWVSWRSPFPRRPSVSWKTLNPSFVLSTSLMSDMGKTHLCNGLCLSVFVSIGFPFDFYCRKTVIFLQPGVSHTKPVIIFSGTSPILQVVE